MNHSRNFGFSSFGDFSLKGLLTTTLIAMAAVGSSQGASVIFSVSNGDWATPASWGGTVPTSIDTAFVRSNRVANVTTVVPTVQVLNIANQTPAGTVNIASGGQLNVNNGSSNALIVGNIASGTGTVNVNGGLLAVTGVSLIGNPLGSVGIVNVNSGTFSTTSNLRLGVSAGATGSITVSGGRVSSAAALTVGDGGTGLLTVQGGTVASSSLSVGAANGAAGTINVSSGRLEVAAVDVFLGERVASGTTSGVLTQSGGSVQLNGGDGRMLIGSTTNANQMINSSATISGGTFGGRFLIGSATGLGGGTSVLTVVGDDAIIGSTSAVGNGIELRATGKIVFQLDATGISTLNYANSNVNFSTGADLWVDGSAYAGGTQTFTLIDGAIIQNFSGLDTSIFGFGPGYTTNLYVQGTDLKLDVTGIPEPSTWALLGLGFGMIVWRAGARRRRA